MTESTPSSALEEFRMPPYGEPFSSNDVPELDSSGFPRMLRGHYAPGRFERNLGAFSGTTHLHLLLIRIAPGGQSGFRHAHSGRDEFVFVMQGEVTLENDSGSHRMSSGDCVGFPAGRGNAHRFVNESDRDAVMLVAGDRPPEDTISFPGRNLGARLEPTGKYAFFRAVDERNCAEL